MTRVVSRFTEGFRDRAEAKRRRRRELRRAVAGDRSGYVFRPSARPRVARPWPWKRSR